MKKGILVCLWWLITSPALAVGPSVTPTSTLVWATNAESDMWQYRIYLASTPGAQTFSTAAYIITHPNSLVTLSDLNNGQYYAIIRAVDLSGNESENSLEVPFVMSNAGVSPVVPLPPLNFTIINN